MFGPSSWSLHACASGTNGSNRIDKSENRARHPCAGFLGGMAAGLCPCFSVLGLTYHRIIAAGAQFASAHVAGAGATVAVKPASNQLLFEVRSGGIEFSYGATTIAMDAAGVIFLATVAATPMRCWHRRMAMFLLGCALLVVGMVVLASGFALVPMVERGFILKSRTAWHAAELSQMIYYTGSIIVLPSATWFLFTIPLWRSFLAGQSVGTRNRGKPPTTRSSQRARRRSHRRR